MIKFWVSCIPLVVGIFFSLASVLFLISFERRINYDWEWQYFEILSEGGLPLIFSIVSAFIGIPLTAFSIKKLEQSDI